MGRKKKPLKKQKTYTLVVCEGETEENYIKYVVIPYLRREGYSSKLKCKRFTNINSIVGFITKPEQHCDAVFLVCDLDECTTDTHKIPYYCDKENKLFTTKELKKLDKGSFYSYPSFEYWYLLHCEANFTPKNGTSKEVEELFKRHLPDYNKPMPENANEATFFIDRIADAIKNEEDLCARDQTQLPFASRLRPKKPETVTNPMSEMAKLIKQLTKVKPKS